jgi:hypothetical protein
MIKIIGGPHQGFITQADVAFGTKVIIQDSTYTVRKLRTGKPKMHGVLYAAPEHWDNERCITHMIDLIEKKNDHRT